MRQLITASPIIWLFALGCTADQSAEIARLREEVSSLRMVAGPPPAALDSFYPPNAPGPILLQEMLALGHALTGVAIDVRENDLELLDARFEAFRTQYTKVSHMVGEWTAAFPPEPVSGLQAALQTGDLEQVMAAVGAVGAVCHDCHVATMAAVQQRYHWGNAAQIRVTDPITSEGLDYPQLMRRLETSFVGITVDLEEGQVDRARTHFDAFKARFGVLKVTCAVCHTTEREYFVDASIEQRLERLGAALRDATPDDETVRALGQDIGVESCLKCHLVHGPAALAQARWKMAASEREE